MQPTEQRDEVHRLARSDAVAALELARAIADPWLRAQALAFVARWIDDSRVEAAARESLASAEQCGDDYQRSAVSAWPIRALVERGHERQAGAALGPARLRALAATPAGSRAEALLLLLQGAWGLGPSTRRLLTEDLADLRGESPHWRVERALLHALHILHGVEPEVASEIAARIVDDECRRKALDAIRSEAPCAPREFFFSP